MALLFMDSFDHYATADVLDKWTSIQGAVTINAGGGRRSSAALRVPAGNTYALKGLPASGSTAILGFAFKSAGSGVKLATVYDGIQGKDHVMIYFNTDGSLAVYRASNAANPGQSSSLTLVGTSPAGIVALSTYVYIEVKVLLHDTTGAATIRVNGAQVLALTNVDTANGSVVWTGAAFTGNSGSQPIDVDDLYVLDGTGAAPWNDFLGDCRVDALYPTGAGATTGWTPSTGANWSCVDETAPNDDTDYTSAAAAALTDTFVVQDAPVVGAAIYGVQHCISTKKTDAGAASVAPVIRHGTTDHVGADLNPTTVYTVVHQIAATNPGTAAQWTEAGFNAAQFGYTRTV